MRNKLSWDRERGVWMAPGGSACVCVAMNKVLKAK